MHFLLETSYHLAVAPSFQAYLVVASFLPFLVVPLAFLQGTFPVAQ
jgi:hypothetical protein